MIRVIAPGGRIGTIVQVRDGVALVRHGRTRAFYALRDLTPAPERTGNRIGQ